MTTLRLLIGYSYYIIQEVYWWIAGISIIPNNQKEQEVNWLKRSLPDTEIPFV